MSGLSNPRVPWRLVWVALGLLGLAGVIAILTIVLLTAPTASGSGSRPVLASVLSRGEGSAACAATNRDPVRSTRAGAHATLIPPGATAVLFCRYGPAGTRVLERSITQGATVSQVSWELNALPSDHGVYSCPSDDGESITADFSYTSGAANPVSVGLSGCQSVTNGYVNRLGLDHPVIAQLAGLIPWEGTIRGRLEICGGPAPGGCRTTTSSGVCVRSRCLHAAQVAIRHAVGSQYPNVQLHRGHFTARVAPGRYNLSLLATGRLGNARVLATARVRVRLHRTTPTAFRLSVR